MERWGPMLGMLLLGHQRLQNPWCRYILMPNEASVPRKHGEVATGAFKQGDPRQTPETSFSNFTSLGLGSTQPARLVWRMQP